MKKIVLSVLAACSLLVGSVGAATSAQAAGNTIYSAWNSTCTVQYKNFNGTIYNLGPSAWSSSSVWMVRVPAGCHGEMGIAGQPELNLPAGTWTSFTAAAPSGSTVRVHSFKN